MFFLDGPCPRCGKSKHAAEVKSQRWVGLSRLLSPGTWGDGYWENDDGTREGMRINGRPANPSIGTGSDTSEGGAPRGELMEPKP